MFTVGTVRDWFSFLSIYYFAEYVVHNSMVAAQIDVSRKFAQERTGYTARQHTLAHKKNDIVTQFDKYEK